MDTRNEFEPKPGDIVIYRESPATVWRRIDWNSDGSTTDDRTSYVAAEKAGDVAALIRRTNPGVRIGIKSSEFGPQVAFLCKAKTGGNIVWLNN